MATATQEQIRQLGERYRVEQTADLVAWSQNYELGKRPLDVFLDLTGIYAGHYGESFVFERNAETGKRRVPVAHEFLAHLEIAYICEALAEYAERPQQVEDFFQALDLFEKEGE
jgi:hypothetical protein